MTKTPHRPMPTAQRWAVTALSLSGVVLVTACGSSGTGSSSSTQSAPASASATGASSGLPCAQITSLRSSLNDLTHTSVSLGSAGKIASDLTTIEQQLTALKGQVNGAFSSQADQLSAGLDKIKTDAAALATNPSTTNFSNLTNAVNSFKATARPIIKQMQAACP